ncbi:transporter substrate-binding domain-containing protein [Nordella sp. HKS 07]|uniref:transporter substrate-binding domain-containing protein n=1 Tax=Nordella sp. HKS 07 TaxID=2712222 RepID=UPI0013E1AE8F|nr:transporter substrate-binding domain-containing protein [Nordella sp. HKS 07]QIG47444.1 transporter substrate-binding domain-containing protein [Nordella sp. HKS 07]
MTLSLSRRAGLGCGLSLVAVLLLGPLAPAQADVLDDVTKAGVIKIGIFEDFPPFASMGSDMKIQGYDTEVAEKLAQALGVKAELVGITGQNRIPYLTEGKVDLLLSIGFSDERAQVVGFTDPYAPYYIAVMGPKEVEVKNAADLAGKTIAVNRGTLEDTEVTKVAPAGADIQRYSDYNGVISAFLSGQAQLMVVGNDVGATILAKNPAIEPVEKFQLLTSPSHMGVKKGETKLQEKVNAALVAMKADGSLNEIAVKWLKQPLPAGF